MDDIGPAGASGHRGTSKFCCVTFEDGSNYNTRIEKYCKWGGSIYESIDYGHEARSPLDVVLALLVDDGLQSRGNRKNLLGDSYKHIGIAAGPHKEYGRVVVITYAAQIVSFEAA